MKRIVGFFLMFCSVNVFAAESLSQAMENGSIAKFPFWIAMFLALILFGPMYSSKTKVNNKKDARDSENDNN